MKLSAKHLLGTGLFLVAALPVFAVYRTGDLSAQPLNHLHAVTMQSTAVATPGGTTTAASTANFTRADYEAALAKWRAQDAAEYRIDVTYQAFSLWGGPWRLTVARDAGREFVTKVERLDNADRGNVTAEDLQLLTIGGIFEKIDEALRKVENPSPDETPYDYNVSFHPTLGYPVSFTAKPQSNLIADADYAYSVQSVIILQTGTYTPPPGGVVPGMPSTGHPER